MVGTLLVGLCGVLGDAQGLGPSVQSGEVVGRRVVETRLQSME